MKFAFLLKLLAMSKWYIISFNGKKTLTNQQFGLISPNKNTYDPEHSKI